MPKPIAKKPATPKPIAPKVKPKLRSPAKSQETVIPADDFSNKIAELFTRTDKLVKFREGKKPEKLAQDKKYNEALKDLGMRVSHLKSVVQATQLSLQEALVRLRVVANSDSADKKLTDKAVVLTQKLSNAIKGVQKLNSAIGVAFKGNTILLERIKLAFKGADSVIANAFNARKLAVQLHQIAPQQKSATMKRMHAPAFVVVDGFTVIGDPTTKSERKITEKIALALQMGAESFPDPFTVLYNSYGIRDLALSPKLKAAVRYLVQFAAARKPLPKRPTVIELYNETGLDSAGHFKYDGLNTMFRAVLGNIERKAKAPEAKAFVLGVNPELTDADFDAAVAHLRRDDGRGKKVIDDIRVRYAQSVVKWFNAYVPVIVDKPKS